MIEIFVNRYRMHVSNKKLKDFKATLFVLLPFKFIIVIIKKLLACFSTCEGRIKVNVSNL
jgi:hypothetical protein